jgi:gliding motility-associated-like protein
LWSNGDLSSSISTLFAGTYTCTVTDANNCIVSEDVIVDQPDPIIPNVTAIDVFCNGGSNGIATANPTGGTGPYDYEWYETTVPSIIISTTSTATGLSAISYTVEVIDALNCPPVTETILMIEPNIIDDGETISNVSCNNGFDGLVDLTVTGGNGNYTFLWSDNQITEDAINLSAGTYSVVITDTLNCGSTFSYQIAEPLNPLEGIPTVTDVLCFGESTGSISVSPQGGTPPYSCFWPFNGQTTFLLYQTLQIGTYTATVTDANGCVAYATGTIDQPDDFTITTSAIPASCYGYNDGSATAIPNGGVLPYSYNWSNGQSSQVNTMLTSGSYNVIVYDSNNCIATKNQFVGEPTQITASISTIDILCNEAETGVITVNTTNGSAGPPYIYSWSNGHNDPINQSLGAGTYYLTITDGDGCFSTFVETLVEPTIISASLSSSDISVSGANDGTISASISGGTPIYIYSWSGPNSFSSSSSSINGLSQGVYTLMVQDANGCQQFFTQIINEPNCNVNIDTTFITPLCFGDVGEIFWQNSGGLAPYSNTLVNSFANVIINGAQYDYPPAPLQLPAGVYDLIVVDADSCFAIWNIPITTPDSIMIDLTTTDVLCNGNNDGTATAVITGGTQPYNIDWGAVDPNLLISGVYNVFVTDVNGCTSEIIPYNINEPTQLQIDSVITTLVSCVPGNDGTATTYASGGVFPYTYYWSNGQSNQMANSLVAGTYVAYVFDANNCMADSTGITITNATSIDIDIIETPISCNGGNDGELIATLLTGSYPLTYSWLDLSSLTPSVVISSDSIISNLSSGGYQLLATDINGCFDQETVSVINPSSITFNLVPFNISSNGAVDGIINTTLISGGQAPYSFFWIGPNGFTSISQNLTNLNAGTYTLTITDANGCETVQSTVINEPGCNVSISLNTTQPLCFNYSGNITWTNSGGSPSYYNVITDLNIPLQLDDSYSSSGTYSLPVGNYALQVTDQYGCSDLQNIEITEPEILLGNYITSPTSCYGGTDGAISVTPTGGTNPYSINYGGVNANQLSAGVYSFILTDNNGCLSAPPLISYEILEPEDIVATLASTYPVDCFGGSNGAATVTAVGGTIPYLYSWSPSGDITSTADNLSPGNQYVTITDANGCSPSSGSFAVNITQPTLALTATITPINISCYGDNDGSATANPSGGTAPYSYLWSNGQITNQINNLVPGTYSCIITDANKCNYTLGVAIDQPTEILANLSVTNITCNGDVDGSAIVNPTGGIGPYSFVWYDNTDINSVSNLPTGFYSVTITDNTSCSTPLITFSVTQPDDLILVASELSGTSCNGGSNGIAAVGVNGGTPFYTYTWLDSLNNLVSTDSFALNLSEATYSVIVIDDNGCIDSTNVLITSPLEISVNVVVDSTLCNGSSNGSATAIPTGGTGPYTYIWSGGQSIGYNATYSSLDALTTYYLTVTDFNNCVSAGNPVNIPEPNPILYTFSSIDQNGFNVSCNDSSDATITTHATGGNSPYQYSSNNILFTNDSTFIDLPSGWLSVYIIDDNGCTATDSVEVTEPDALDPNINIITSVTCSGGSNGSLASIVQGGVGGFLYTWSNANLGVLNQGLSEGTYSVVVTDDNGCIGIDSITLVADFEIETNSSTTPISCTGFNDGVAEMQPNGGTAPYTYLWNNGNTTAVNQGLGAGIYWCTISDANGCSTTDTVSVIESSTSLEIISSQVLHVTCNGGTDGSATITATGGTGGIYSFQWNDINLQTTQVAAGLNADTFIVSVTDLAFCTVYDTIIVNEPAPIYAAINHLDISCYGFFDGILSATVSGGINPYSLSWSGPNSYSSNLDSISDLGLGEYILSIIDSNGCTLLDTSVILEPSPLTYVASVTNPSCFAISDGEVSLDISGGNMPYSAVYASFLASYPTNNSAIISNLSAGSDTLYVYDANGCENFSFVNLINPLELSIDNINITNATCFDYSDGSVSVSVLGGTSPYSYQLSDDLGAIFSTTAATFGLIAGTYEYQIIDVNNCIATTMAIVEEPDEIEIVQEVSCYGSILVDVLNTLGDYQIFWEGDISDSIFINDLSAGQYIVTVIDDVGCVKVDSFEVNGLINYSIFDASCLTIPDGVIEIFDIYLGNAPYSLSLNNSLLDDDVVSTYNIDNLLAGSYLVTLVDADSCSFSDSLLVDYIGGYDCINEPIIISPNSDGTNDNWHPIYDIDTEMEVIILNRWGEREFYYSGNSLVFEWDGLSNNGNKLSSTDYYYIIKFKDNNYPDRTGVITLIR